MLPLIHARLVSLTLFLDKLLQLLARLVQQESFALTQQWILQLETVILVTIALEDQF